MQSAHNFTGGTLNSPHHVRGLLHRRIISICNQYSPAFGTRQFDLLIFPPESKKPALKNACFGQRGRYPHRGLQLSVRGIQTKQNKTKRLGSAFSLILKHRSLSHTLSTHPSSIGVLTLSFRSSLAFLFSSPCLIALLMFFTGGKENRSTAPPTCCDNPG